MEKVFISKENWKLLEKNTPLTLEQALWYTQDEGYIPLPKKCNKQNIRVLFSDVTEGMFIKFSKKKITKFKVSDLVNKKTNSNFGHIYVFELTSSGNNNNYYYIHKSQKSYVFHSALTIVINTVVNYVCKTNKKAYELSQNTILT